MAQSKKAPNKKKVAATKKARGQTKKKSVAKKAAHTGELDPSLEWSLDEVERHLPSAAAEDVALLKELLLGAHTEEQLVALGAQYRTEDILQAAPTFLVGVLLALKKLGKAPPGLGTPLLRLVLEEARELEHVNARFEQELRDVASEISGRRAELKAANSEALDARRSIARALLRGVLPAGSKERAELESAAAGAETPAATVASARSVARIVTELRKVESYDKALRLLNYDDAFVRGLEERADRVERLARLASGLTPPQKTSQTALDVQDGIVCTLLRAVWAPLRSAKADGAAVRLPPVGALERLFVSRSSGGAEDDDEDAGGGGPPPGV